MPDGYGDRFTGTTFPSSHTGLADLFPGAEQVKVQVSPAEHVLVETVTPVGPAWLLLTHQQAARLAEHDADTRAQLVAHLAAEERRWWRRLRKRLRWLFRGAR